MKLTNNWLKTYLETKASPAELANKMTCIGLEVEETIDNAKKLDGFIIGEIRSVNKHPNADKLHVLTVFDGKNDLQIVCGAPNVRVGMKSVLALPDVMIPKYNEKLQKGIIRGVESCGMLCAEDELCIGTDHTGIIDLKTELSAGTPAAEAFNTDVLFDVNVTPNRPDCFGVRGIARDLSATGIGTYIAPKEEPVRGTFSSPVSVTIEDKNCQMFVLRYIKNVQNKQSPDWMQKRLIAAGLRPISALVDVTNYLNVDQCRPLHVFDADKLTGNLVVRSAKNGETISCLDGKTYTLEEGMTVVADDKGAQSIAGIMGGVDTACDENTKNVVIESAYFTPLSIATTGHKINAESDSRTRFERGIDPNSCMEGNINATNLILSICGGEPSEAVTAGGVPSAPAPICFDFGLVERLTGLKIPQKTMTDILQKLGFRVDGNNVSVPFWRIHDVKQGADLVEEIVRIYGLDTLPEAPMRPTKLPIGTLLSNQKREVAVRRALANAGLYQAITWSFMDSKLAKLFHSKGIILTNPIASDLDEMRPSLVPNLLSAVARNIDKGWANVQLFEVGPEFINAEPNGQRIIACAMRAGHNHARAWNDTMRTVDCFDAKADAFTTLMAAGAPTSVQVTPTAPDWYHPQRAGSFTLGKNVLAVFGEIHPAILTAFGIKETVVACEVYLDALPPMRAKAPKPFHATNLMPLSRDFAFLMDTKVEADKLINAIANIDKDLIANVRIFDVYEGDKLPTGQKSVAIEVTIQPKDKTLTDAEIDSLSRRIILCAEKTVGAKLRA